MYLKKTRIHEREVLKDVKKNKCVVCKKPPVGTDHIIDISSGGSNTFDNLWPLCRRHYEERHQVDICTFIDRYESAYEWLIFNFRLDVIDKCNKKL